MHTKARPISVSYKNVNYKSLAEGRWAAFFDNLGIDYEYEPQKFRLPSGIYVPDFKLHLPKAEFLGEFNRYIIWAEVKNGSRFDVRIPELVQTTNQMVLLLSGPPSLSSYVLYSGPDYESRNFSAEGDDGKYVVLTNEDGRVGNFYFTKLDEPSFLAFNEGARRDFADTVKAIEYSRSTFPDGYGQKLITLSDGQRHWVPKKDN